MSLIIIKNGNEPMVHEAMAYVESLGIPATQIRRITVDAQVGQPLVVGLELFVPVDGTEPQKSDSGTCVIVGEMCTTHGQHASRCAPQKSDYGVDLKSTVECPVPRCKATSQDIEAHMADYHRGPDTEDPCTEPPGCDRWHICERHAVRTDNTSKSHYGVRCTDPECPSASIDNHAHMDPAVQQQLVAEVIDALPHSADHVACSGEREGICSGGPAHHPDCPSAQPRKLIGPPHAHLDAPCTDACYEAAETVLWIDQDGRGHTAVPGVDMTDMGWTLA